VFGQEVFNVADDSVADDSVTGVADDSITDANVSDVINVADDSVADSSASGELQVSESLWPVSDISHLEMDASLTFNEYSYIQPDTSLSELDMSYIAPTYSPVQSPVDEHSFAGPPVHDWVAQPLMDDRAVTADRMVPQPNTWSGFKITIDNIDKNFRPTFQRVHHQTKSLHCVHMYAAKDRLDLSGFSNSTPQNVIIIPGDILPSDSDLCSLKEHFKVLVARYVWS